MKLTIELIPSPLHYKSLRVCISPFTWGKIKEKLYEKEGRKCWICGSDYFLQAHEFFEYDMKKLIQKLVGIHHLCFKCHMIKHLAFSKTEKGKEALKKHNLKSEDLINHFCKINNCQKKDFEEHYNGESKNYIKRSAYDNWKQNFGEYSYLIKNISFQKPLKKT